MVDRRISSIIQNWKERNCKKLTNFMKHCLGFRKVMIPLTYDFYFRKFVTQMKLDESTRNLIIANSQSFAPRLSCQASQFRTYAVPPSTRARQAAYLRGALAVALRPVNSVFRKSDIHHLATLRELRKLLLRLLAHCACTHIGS